MKRYDLIVIGAGPSGLSASIEGAKRGMQVAVFDENNRPGGQLFKQIHKFFGSKAHKAKIRGIDIGKNLLAEAKDAGVDVCLNATVTGLYMDKELLVRQGDEMRHYKGDTIVVATGAAENMTPFEGWTLPGVIGAGAAQTMMNLYGVRPGDRVLMLGTGNVGLVVSFQLLQAGCEVVALVDAAPKIGGYGVHAAKVARTGVPFYLSHTITKAEGKDKVMGVEIAAGKDKVMGVEIAAVDQSYTPIAGTQKHFDVDTICIAVGLSPMSQLLKMGGCTMAVNPAKGGQVPVIDAEGQTTVPGIFAAGDVSGIEEASSAMIEGRMAGVCAAAYLGFCEQTEKIAAMATLEADLDSLRQGMFAPFNRGKIIVATDEGIAISQSLLTKGYLAQEEVARFPGVTHQSAIHPVIECTQNIPCNPCQDACVKGCIKIGDKMTALPAVNTEASCTGCGMCVASCSGQAIFLVDEGYAPGFASITIPYEFLPLPEKGECGQALGRKGEPLAL